MPTNSKLSNNKILVIIILVFALLAAGVIGLGVIRRSGTADALPIKIDGVYFTTGKEINDFALTDTANKAFTKANLKNHWTLMFFGFTNCGFVCPTTLAALNKMYLTLQKDLPADQLPKVVLISVDPDRDSIEKINSYVTAFNPNFVGAKGDVAATIDLEKQLHVAAVKLQAQGQSKDHYTINHSAEIMVFNPAGQLQAYLSYPHKPEQMVADYKLMLQAYGK
jgi:protein SCO1/2